MRNECNRVIRRSKRKFEKILSEESKTNPMLFWKYVQSKVKSASGISQLKSETGHLSVTNAEKANTLNEFFSSVFIPENLIDLPVTELGDKSKGIILTDLRITPDAVFDKLLKLNKGKAQGPDEVPPRVLLELSKELSIPLSILFNKSLETGKIPTDWKDANVVAIFKKGTKSVPGNYRPVSLTCVVCKLLESFIRDAIVDHMNKFNIYSNCQHGFRKRRSCVTQLMQVMEDFTEFIENKSAFDVIYLDFQKAFDQVPHQRLLSKLAGIGIGGNIHKWILDFLFERKQKVHVGNSYSRSTNVLSGIPQGSILGPVLFTIFINDLPDWVNSNCKIFADDTKLYSESAKCLQLQNDINELQKWSAKWNLFFNADKCKVMHFGRNNAKYNYTMKLNDNEIMNVINCEEEKDLGVIFDSKLSFDAHVQCVISKANRNIGIIRRTFRYLSRKSFIQLYKSLVRPHLEYGNTIWFPCLKRQSSSIEKVQRRATRFLFERNTYNYVEITDFNASIVEISSDERGYDSDV